MSNPSKNKGSRFEREIADYLRSLDIQVDRTRVGWADDRGDIHGIPGVVIECKNHKTMDLAQWIRELDNEMHNADAGMGCVVHKRRGTTDASQHYATLRFGTFIQLLREAGYVIPSNTQ
jgi:hypothetical protein